MQDWRNQPTVDPRITEKYLRALPGVQQAKVWIERGELRARVVMIEGVATMQELREMCAIDLGWSYAPRRIKCEVLAADAA